MTLATDKCDVEVTVQIDHQFLLDLMTTAVEGGINYWGAVIDLNRDSDLNVLNFEVTDFEGEEAYTYSVDSIAMLNALQALIKAYPWRVKMLDGDYDAEDADCVVQFACFGELVYG